MGRVVYVNATPVPATTATPHAAPAAAKAAAATAGQAALPPWALVVAFTLAVALIVAVVFKVMGSEGGARRVLGLTYNPEKRLWKPAELLEVVPGVYTDREYRVIAFIPTNAPTDTLMVKGALGWRRVPVYPLVRYGDTYSYVDFSRALGISLARSALNIERVKGVAELIAKLYASGELPAEMRVRPDLSVYVYVDGPALAAMVADIYDRAAEESIVAISQITGKRMDFVRYVKAMIEAKSKAAEAITSAALKIAVPVAFIIMVLGLLMYFGAGGH